MVHAESLPTTTDSGEAAIQILNLTLTAMIVAQAISAAAQLGIADLLKNGPRSAEELARGSKTHAPSLYRLLRALTTAGVVVEQPGRMFALTSLGEALRRDAPDSMWAMAVLSGARWRVGPWLELVESIKSGQHAFQKVHDAHQYEYLSRHPEEAEVFDAAMTSLSRQDARAILAVYDLSNVGRMVDVGGGQGTFLVELMRAHPSLRGIVFDRPPVAERATQYLAQEGLAMRAEVVPGDFLKAVPPGGDLYAIKNVLLDWDDGKTATILKNCRRAMSPRSRLIVVEPIIPGPEEPHFGKLLDLEMLIIPGGRARTVAEFTELLTAVAFRVTRVVPTPGPVSLIEAIPV
jgi:precorrin-6B methylase 2